MLTQVAEDIFQFLIPLPDNPLKSLNCYIVRPADGGRCLLIDTGFRQPACWQALREGMDEAGLRPENTDVFLSHLHSDHTGNAADLHALGCRILMPAVDYQRYCTFTRNPTAERWKRAVREGMPPELAERSFVNGPIVTYSPPWFPATELKDGDELSYGRYHFCCLLTPGHTPGHMCLYEERYEILFSGDHILFDITPNICNFEDMKDSLGAYLESLRRMRELPVQLTLPAHRGIGGMTMVERIDQILEHHRRRLDEALQAIRTGQPIDAYHIAAQLRWKIRANSWEDFPLSQKWFAIGETLAHLDYLRGIGAITREEQDGLFVYRLREEQL